mgnify:CR=1 FL=1
MLSDNLLLDLEQKGIVHVKNFFDSTELEKARKIVKNYSVKKGHKLSYFSTNLKLLSYKLLKFNFRRFSEDIFFLNLAKKKELDKFSDRHFKRKSFLKFIDAYYSEISNQDVLPWHTDQAYEGDEKNDDGFVNPDNYHIKFFIYLTDVGPQNGCMSYIPYSHILGYIIRKGIYNNEIKFDNYFLLKEFRSFCKKNKEYLIEKLKDKQIFDKFLEETEFIEFGKDTKKFDYSLKAGDAIIFNEGGVHKGSRSTISERMVLRYLYSSKK